MSKMLGDFKRFPILTAPSYLPMAGGECFELTVRMCRSWGRVRRARTQKEIAGQDALACDTYEYRCPQTGFEPCYRLERRRP